MRVAICEDINGDAEILSEYVRASGTEVQVDVFGSGEEFIRGFQRGKYHIVFLDIYMGSMTGIDTAAAMRAIDPGVPVAFATISRDFALEANRFRSVMYMEKPVDPSDVAHCLQVAQALREQRRKETLSVTASDLSVYEIPYYEIVMIEVKSRRCMIHRPAGIPLEAVTSLTMDALEKKLPTPPFLRCHRSYIINMHHVTGSEGPDLIMSGGLKAYIRVKDERKVKAACNNFAIALLRGKNHKA